MTSAVMRSVHPMNRAIKLAERLHVDEPAPTPFALAGAAARERELRAALRGHEWKVAARLIFVARSAHDHRILGHGTWCEYVETLGISRSHASRLFLVGAFEWSDHELAPHFAEALEQARHWRDQPTPRRVA